MEVASIGSDNYPYNFLLNDICKYLVKWPSGSTTKDELIFDVNILERTDLYLIIAESYTDTNPTVLKPNKGDRIRIAYPKQIYVVYIATEIFYGRF